MQTDAYPPLASVRVLDASRVLAGPFCGQILGDLGAEVIKVERPGTGDETRAWGPPFSGPPSASEKKEDRPPEERGQPSFFPDALSAYFLSCNRNKRSITIDLAKEEGCRLFRQLVGQCDVVLENFRTDSAERLGLTPEQLLQVQPRLILCSLSGFGRTGPWAERPGYDFAIQALSGFMQITGPVDGPPCKVGVAVTDVLTGLYAATAILACLHARTQSGHGYAIDLALLDCAIAAQVNVAQAYLTSGQMPLRQGNAHLQIVPYQLFATADGWLVLAIGNDGQWRSFCDAAGRPELSADPRFTTNPLRVQNRTILVPMTEEILRSRSTGDWEAALTQHGVPHAPVLDYPNLFSQEQAAARGLRMTVRDPAGRKVDLVGSPFRIAGSQPPRATMPPRLGEHTDMVLHDVLGLDANEIANLHARGVV